MQRWRHDGLFSAKMMTASCTLIISSVSCRIATSSSPQHSTGMNLFESMIRIFLVASDARLESELLGTLRKEVGWRRQSQYFEIVFCPLEQTAEVLLLLDFLDRIRDGVFHAMYTRGSVIPPISGHALQSIKTTQFVNLLTNLQIHFESLEWKWCSGSQNNHYYAQLRRWAYRSVARRHERPFTQRRNIDVGLERVPATRRHW